MVKKYVSVSVSVTQEQLTWLHKQPNSLSSVVRGLIEGSMPLKPLDEPEANAYWSDLLFARKACIGHVGTHNLADFQKLENYMLSFQPGAYDVQDLKATTLSNVDSDNKDMVWRKYFTPVEALDEDERKSLKYAIQDETLRLRCLPDLPDKVVYAEFTVKDLVQKFDIKQTYTTNEIALKLGINYVQAYRYIRPWLLAHGFKVESHAKSP
jgi:hypothetical protein